MLDVLQRRTQYDVTPTSWAILDSGAAPHIYVDVQVVNNSQGSLQTLTVLVKQLDIDNGVLGEQRVVLDVSALTPGIGQGVGMEVRPVQPNVEGISVELEGNPPRDAWREFPELDAVRPRI